MTGDPLDAANALNEARGLVKAAIEIAFMLTVVGEHEGDGAVNIEAVGVGLDCVLRQAELRLDEACAGLAPPTNRRVSRKRHNRVVD